MFSLCCILVLLQAPLVISGVSIWSLKREVTSLVFISGVQFSVDSAEGELCSFFFFFSFSGHVLRPDFLRINYTLKTRFNQHWLIPFCKGLFLWLNFPFTFVRKARLKISDSVIALTGHWEPDVWQIENTLNGISAITAALAMAVMMSSWEASEPQSELQPSVCSKRSCDQWVGPTAESWWAARLGPLAAGFWKQGAPTPSPALGIGWGLALSSLLLLQSREGSLWGFFELTV